MKKTKILFLLSLLSVVFLFAACDKEKNDNGNVNDTPNTANQGDTSIEDNRTGESSGIITDGSDKENDNSADERANNEASDSSKLHNDTVITEREYKYDFEGKYWFAEAEKEALYFNGFQYIYFNNDEVITGAYKIVDNKIKTSQDAFFYSSNESKTFHLASDYELKENSFVLYKGHDDGGRRLDDGTSFDEITQEDFHNLTKMNFVFTKLPDNTYWKDISTYSPNPVETIFHFDGTTLISYEKSIIAKQKYSINDYAIILEPTQTLKQNFEHSGETTIDYKSDIKEDYSLSNNLLIINHIVSVINRPPYMNDIENAIVTRLFIQIDEETAKNIINENYIK